MTTNMDWERYDRELKAKEAVEFVTAAVMRNYEDTEVTSDRYLNSLLGEISEVLVVKLEGSFENPEGADRSISYRYDNLCRCIREGHGVSREARESAIELAAAAMQYALCLTKLPPELTEA